MCQQISIIIIKRLLFHNSELKLHECSDDTFQTRIFSEIQPYSFRKAVSQLEVTGYLIVSSWYVITC